MSNNIYFKEVIVLNKKKNITISFKIIFTFTLSLAIIFVSLILYINCKIKPDISENMIQQSLMLVEAKSSEVGMWIYRKIDEFRILAEVPAIKSADVRGIKPLIDNLIESYKANGDIMETFAYGGINNYSGFNWVNAEAILDLIEYEDYRKIIDNKKEYAIGNPVVTDDNREVLLFYYPVKGYNDKYDGLFCTAIPTVRLKEIVNSMRIYNGKTWIMNKDGDILTTPKSYFNQKFLSEEQIKELINNNDMSKLGYTSTKNINNGNDTLFFSPVPNSEDWIFCTLVSNSEIYKNVDGMIKGLTFVCLILMLINIFVGYVLSKSVVFPIKKLQHQMDLVEHGNMKAYYTQKAHDEIYYLGVSYNKMLDQINKLIEKIYAEQKQKRKAELQILQEQIKPHFLYNTLDTLKWMAKDYEAEDIAKTITSLSTFFRVLLSNGEEQITLKQEFKHTKSYLEIQQTRYSQVLSYEINIDKNIENIKIIKILVQPLVENAIYHGIKNKKQKGFISINGFLQDKNIIITVADNGIGMDTKTLENLKINIKADVRNEHYGLHNIYERLVLEYGNDAKLLINSMYDKGTKVTLVIPVREENF